MTTQEQVQAYLESFQSPGDIASVCERDGITGTRRQCEGCVIARLLLSKFPELGRVSINPSRFHHLALYFIDRHRDLPLPEPVNTFASKFDSGDYPHLETV